MRLKVFRQLPLIQCKFTASNHMLKTKLHLCEQKSFQAASQPAHHQKSLWTICRYIDVSHDHLEVRIKTFPLHFTEYPGNFEEVFPRVPIRFVLFMAIVRRGPSQCHSVLNSCLICRQTFVCASDDDAATSGCDARNQMLKVYENCCHL